LVTREELRAQVWPAETFVDFDHSLHNTIARLREALGDSAGTPRYIETPPRRGYRIIGTLEKVGVEESPLSPPIETSREAPVSPLQSRRGATLIAVLPLDNFSGDPAQEYFADGRTDELITDLAKIGALRVISRTFALSA
jgi:DNA-binding winged helix-turn-helix (wHTH) protein